MSKLYTPKGVCRLSIVPVRREPADTAEQVTQLLFGEHYEVIDESADGKWYKIRMVWDGYEGWVDVLQHHSIGQEHFEQIDAVDYKICLEVTSSILYRKRQTPIVLGSVLPLSPNELFQMDEQLAFNGDAKSLSQRRDFEFVRQVSLRYLGAPYQWGGKSPFGIDCSGFTQMVFKLAGYKLARDAYQQALQGEKVEAVTSAQPGDLAFFSHDGLKISHVGVILEENKIIHASGQVRKDELGEDGIYHRDSKKKTHALHSLRRMLKSV